MGNVYDEYFYALYSSPNVIRGACGMYWKMRVAYRGVVGENWGGGESLSILTSRWENNIKVDA
jgi:hypothetical protein